MRQKYLQWRDTPEKEKYDEYTSTYSFSQWV